MSTTLFPALLPNTDRVDDYTPLKKGDGDDDESNSNGTEISDISPEYTEVSESTTDENTEDTD
jgi:hypothetical protein